MSTKLVYLVLALPLLASCKATESSEPAQAMEASAGRGQVDMDEIMAEMMAKATPGAQHALLQTLVGEWDDTLRMRMSADQPWEESKGTSTFRSVLGGRFVIEETEGEFAGMPMAGMGIYGYDNLHQRFTLTWRDSMSTWPMSSTGTADASGKKIDYVGTAIDILTPEGRPTRMTLDLSQEGRVEVEMFDTIDGKQVKVMEITAIKRN